MSCAATKGALFILPLNPGTSVFTCGKGNNHGAQVKSGSDEVCQSNWAADDANLTSQRSNDPEVANNRRELKIQMKQLVPIYIAPNVLVQERVL